MKRRDDRERVLRYVIRTAAGLYVGPDGMVRAPEQAIQFRQRFAALARVAQLGYGMSGAVIKPFAILRPREPVSGASDGPGEGWGLSDASDAPERRLEPGKDKPEP